MIKIYKRTLRIPTLEESEYSKGVWVNCVDPDDNDCAFIQEIAGLEKEEIEEVNDEFEPAHIIRNDNSTSVLIQVPYKQGDSFNTAPLMIVITESSIITICTKKLTILEGFISGKDPIYTTQKTKFLLQILEKIEDLYDTVLKKITKRVKNKKVNLRNLNNNDVLELVEVEEVLTNFLTSMIPNGTIYDKIKSGKVLAIHKNDKELLEDLAIDAKQNLELCKLTSRTVKNIRDAYSTILGNNLNNIMKLLTSVTIILTVPTLISSVFGMNVDLPFQASESAFVFILIFIFLSMGVLYSIFRLSRWF